MNTSVRVITQFSSPFDSEFETFVLKESEHFCRIEQTDHIEKGGGGGGVTITNCLIVCRGSDSILSKIKI